MGEFLKMMTHKILNRDPKDEILKAFRLFDDDETGKISFKNLKRVAKKLGERMTDEELQEMIDEADRWRWRSERGGVPPHHEEDKSLLRSPCISAFLCCSLLHVEQDGIGLVFRSPFLQNSA